MGMVHADKIAERMLFILCTSHVVNHVLDGFSWTHHSELMTFNMREDIPSLHFGQLTSAYSIVNKPVSRKEIFWVIGVFWVYGLSIVFLSAEIISVGWCFYYIRYIRPVFQENGDDFRMARLYRYIERGCSVLVLRLHIRPMFQEDSDNFRVAFLCRLV